MKVLISGGRAPYALELVRILAKQGHAVYILEFVPFSLSSFSKYVTKTFNTTAPNINETSFLQEILDLLEKENFDLFIPSCEEAIHLSKYKKQINEYTSLFVDDFNNVLKLHDKFEFMECLKELSLSHPYTAKNSDSLDENKKYIVKRQFSRFGTHVKNYTGQKLHNGEIVQEKASGLEYSLYSVLFEGKVNAWALYPKQYSIAGGATNYFEHQENKEVLMWLEKVSEKLHLHGQYSFDLFIDGANVIYPIECNPRTTSGLHLLEDSITIDDFLKSKETIQGSEKAKMIFFSMLIFSLNLKDIKKTFQDIMRADDIIFDLKDFLPAIGQFLSLIYFAIISLKRRVHIVNATTLDIEYNHLK